MKAKLLEEQKKRTENQLQDMKVEERKAITKESDKKNSKIMSELREQIERLQKSEGEMKDQEDHRLLEQKRQQDVLH